MSSLRDSEAHLYAYPPLTRMGSIISSLRDADVASRVHPRCTRLLIPPFTKDMKGGHPFWYSFFVFLCIPLCPLWLAFLPVGRLGHIKSTSAAEGGCAPCLLIECRIVRDVVMDRTLPGWCVWLVLPFLRSSGCLWTSGLWPLRD